MDKAKKKEYMREYFKKYPERRRIAQQKWVKNNRDKKKEANERWRLNNKEKFNAVQLASRKRKAQKLKEQGQMYTFLPRTQRENKMVEKLAVVYNIDSSDARELLITTDWNIKALISKMEEKDEIQ